MQAMLSLVALCVCPVVKGDGLPSVDPLLLLLILAPLYLQGFRLVSHDRVVDPVHVVSQDYLLEVVQDELDVRGLI